MGFEFCGLKPIIIIKKICGPRKKIKVGGPKPWLSPSMLRAGPIKVGNPSL